MAKLVRRHTSNVEIISSNLVGSILFATRALENPAGIGNGLFVKIFGVIASRMAHI